jgi:hypothetical protein
MKAAASTKARTARFTAPYFKAHATVHIFLHDTTSYHPDAKVRVVFYISHRDDVHRGGREAAQDVFRRVGTDQKVLDAAEYEVSVDEYTACDARYVRNPNHEPVQAFAHPEKKDEERLIKQRRLVPESHQEMVKLYGPKPAVAAEPVVTA